MIVNEPLSVSPAPATSANEWVSPASGSVADSAPTVVPTAWFSGTLELESPMSVGASLVGVVVIVNAFSKKRVVLSVDRTRMA